MPFVRFLYGWHGEHWLEWGVEGVGCAIVLGAGGFGLRHSPLRCRGGIWPPAFPTLLAGGALATTGKKLTERLEAPCVFLYTGPPLCKQACNGLSGYKKSPQALLESFFPLLR